MIFAVFVCDPSSGFPEFDYQTWYHMSWKGTAIPGGCWMGEWAWVGRVYE